MVAVTHAVLCVRASAQSSGCKRQTARSAAQKRRDEMMACGLSSTKGSVCMGDPTRTLAHALARTHARALRTTNTASTVYRSHGSRQTAIDTRTALLTVIQSKGPPTLRIFKESPRNLYWDRVRNGAVVKSPCRVPENVQSYSCI